MKLGLIVTREYEVAAQRMQSKRKVPKLGTGCDTFKFYFYATERRLFPFSPETRP